MDQAVVLADTEWPQVLAILANATGPGINWSVTNPLVMKIGDQLRAQQTGQPAVPQGNGLDLEAEPAVRQAQRRPAR